MRSIAYVHGVKDSYSHVKKTSRTRTGCLTCKSRRIKCDEAKPRCHRCVKSGRVCHGYDIPKTWVVEMPRGSGKSMREENLSLVTARTSSPFNGMPLRLAEEPRMQHLLQRFFTYTTASNALYGNRNLWTVLLPQLVHQEAAVKHLSVALVSITNTHSHQAQITGVKPGPNDNLEYFKHIDKALRRITGQKGDFPPAFILPCSLLLALGESLRTGGPFLSVQHVRAGINIINAWKTDESRVSGSSLDWAEIVPICSPFFAGLVRRASALGACEDLIKTIPWLQNQDVDRTHVPPVFESIQPAAFCLDAIVGYWVMPLLGEKTLAIARQPSMVQELLEKFIVTFDLFVEKRLRYNPSSNEMAKIAMLKAGHCAATVIARCCPSDSEMPFDKVHDYFAEIVSLFNGLQDNSRAWPELNSTNLQTPTGRIMPLFLTATKCRDWTTRTQALELLSAFQECREAAWNGRVAYCIAEAVISLETSDRIGQTNHGLVPNASRIRLTFADYEQDAENSMILSYKHFPYDQSEDHTVKVLLTDPEDVSAASEMDWANQFRLFTTPPYLTDVSPWSLFCKRSIAKASTLPPSQEASLFELAKQYQHDDETDAFDPDDSTDWPE